MLHFYTQETDGLGSDGQGVVECPVERVREDGIQDGRD